MNKCRVTFRNYDLLTKNAKERLENELKSLYWKQGEEPENWRNFDGDFVVENELSRGGDCATFSSENEKWFDWAFDFIKSQGHLRDIEVFLTPDNVDWVESHDKRKHIDSIKSHMYNRYYSFYN